MRQIALDTETTGLEVHRGHRIIEIGAIEIVDRVKTGRSFHAYLNPEREVDPGAFAVHGLSNEFLADKPFFSDIADEFVAFVRDAELLIHNAAFDRGFLNAEFTLGRLSWQLDDIARVVDTLALARQQYPGQRASLDALCKRFAVDNSGRAFHGAKLDADLLADVYLSMTAGQVSLLLDTTTARSDQQSTSRPAGTLRQLAVRRAGDDENAVHQARLQQLDKAAGSCLWLRLEQAAG